MSDAAPLPAPADAAIPGTVLLCLDLQPAFLPVMAGAELLLRRSHLALAAATGLHLPVAFTEQVPAKLGPTESTALALAPGAAVFDKTTFSAFGAPALAPWLGRAGAEHLLLCGLETPVCVYQTALDAVAQGLQVTLLADAVGARRPADHDLCLAALRTHGVTVLPAETVFYSILRDSGHPFFREYTRLVKLYG